MKLSNKQRLHWRTSLNKSTVSFVLLRYLQKLNKLNFESWKLIFTGRTK